MSDIVERLRAWVYFVEAVPASDIMDEAAAEIERLRNGSLVVCETVRLTDAEREAVEAAANGYELNGDDDECASTAATLRGLLERLGGAR